MQVSATVLVTQTGICMLRLHLVSDHLHLPGATMFSSAAAVTWGVQLLVARALMYPDAVRAMVLFMGVC